MPGLLPDFCMGFPTSIVHYVRQMRTGTAGNFVGLVNNQNIRSAFLCLMKIY